MNFMFALLLQITVHITNNATVMLFVWTQNVCVMVASLEMEHIVQVWQIW